MKQMTRDKRGTRKWQVVALSNPLPCDWAGFLRVDQNKIALFQLLSEQLIVFAKNALPHKEVLVAVNSTAISTHSRDISELTLCSQEEADKRLFLHVLDARKNSAHQKILKRTVDTDVVVLAVSNWQKLSVHELWVAIGVGNHFRFIPVFELAECLGPAKSEALLFFHAVTGCDTVSGFFGYGKQKA